MNGNWMDSVDNFVVPKQNPVGLEGPRMELGLYFMCKDMEKDARWTEGEGEHHACTYLILSGEGYGGKYLSRDIFAPLRRRNREQAQKLVLIDALVMHIVLVFVFDNARGQYRTIGDKIVKT